MASQASRTLLGTALAALLLAAGCATPPAAETPSVAVPVAPRAAEAAAALRSGIAHYEGARYEASRTELRRALALGPETPAEAVLAHKYLAFILCASGQTEPCREAFRAALRIDPQFTLTRGEAGHPMWGPVFVQVRRELAPAAR